VFNFLDHANFDCWDLRSPLGDARPNLSFAFVGDSGRRFEQDCKFYTQSVTPFSLGKSPVVVGLRPSTVHRCRDSPWQDKCLLVVMEVLVQRYASLRGRRD